jgi:hypothetical protein
MKKIFKNPITTIVGVVVIAIKILSLRGKINADEATTIITGLSGLGLIAAKDGNNKDSE